jgi:hypothetical protein
MKTKRIDAGWYETTINGQLYTFKDTYMTGSNNPANSLLSRWRVIEGEYGKGKGLHYTHSLSDAKDWLEKHIKAVTK